MTKLSDNERCYGCGKENPSGLRAEFTVDRSVRAITGRFIPRPEHEGFSGIVHGGVIAALLDEAMVKLAWSLGLSCVSAELNVRLLAPAAAGDTLSVSARISNEGRKLVRAESEVSRGPMTIATAQAKLVKIT